MKIENNKCLLLNADYTPLTIISWRRAVVWSIKYEYNMKYAIEIIDFYKDDFIRGVNKNIPIPAVAKTKRYFRIHGQSVNFCRKNLFIRDNYTCQYCGVVYDAANLTYDHVIPKSVWPNSSSPTCWTNIVTACGSCNRRKGNKTPKQANMPLKSNPYVPQKNIKYLPIGHHLLKIKADIPEEWKDYLPESYIS